MRQTDQFALQAILELRITVIAEARPILSDEADFLFLALDTRAVARCLASCPHRDALPPTLDRSELKTRVREWLLDTVHWERGRRPYPSVLLSLALIDHDYEGTTFSEQAQEVLKDEVVVLGIERAPWETEDKLHWFEQMPYPSTLHLPLRRAPLQPRVERAGSLAAEAGKEVPVSSPS